MQVVGPEDTPGHFPWASVGQRAWLEQAMSLIGVDSRSEGLRGRSLHRGTDTLHEKCQLQASAAGAVPLAEDRKEHGWQLRHSKKQRSRPFPLFLQHQPNMGQRGFEQDLEFWQFV